MSDQKHDKGGVVPGPARQCRVWVKEGLVSFDGPDGPWSRILTPEQIRELAKENTNT